MLDRQITDGVWMAPYMHIDSVHLLLQGDHDLPSVVRQKGADRGSGPLHICSLHTQIVLC